MLIFDDNLEQELGRLAVLWGLNRQQLIERLIRESIWKHIAALNSEEGQTVIWQLTTQNF